MTRKMLGLPGGMASRRRGPGWRWYCRACDLEQPKALRPFSTSAGAVESWARHITGPDHRAEVAATSVARIVYRIVVERRPR